MRRGLEERAWMDLIKCALAYECIYVRMYRPWMVRLICAGLDTRDSDDADDDDDRRVKQSSAKRST